MLVLSQYLMEKQAVLNLTPEELAHRRTRYRELSATRRKIRHLPPGRRAELMLRETRDLAPARLLRREVHAQKGQAHARILAREILGKGRTDMFRLPADTEGNRHMYNEALKKETARLKRRGVRPRTPLSLTYIRNDRNTQRKAAAQTRAKAEAKAKAKAKRVLASPHIPAASSTKAGAKMESRVVGRLSKLKEFTRGPLGRTTLAAGALGGAGGLLARSRTKTTIAPKRLARYGKRTLLLGGAAGGLGLVGLLAAHNE